jgi:hypothetical protein
VQISSNFLKTNLSSICFQFYSYLLSDILYFLILQRNQHFRILRDFVYCCKQILKNILTFTIYLVSTTNRAPEQVPKNLWKPETNDRTASNFLLVGIFASMEAILFSVFLQQSFYKIILRDSLVSTEYPIRACLWPRSTQFCR